MQKEENKVFEPMPEPEASHENPIAELPSAEEADELRDARRNMVAGLLWCLGGLAFTFASYYFTQAGGRYFVATGAILWGAIQAIKGWWLYLRLHYNRGEYGSVYRSIGLAIGCAVLLAGLGRIAFGMAEQAAIGVIDHEQTIDIPSVGVRITVPAGYTETETERQEETDDRYALQRISTYNGLRGITVEATEKSLEAEGIVRVDEMSDYLENAAAEFLDDGIIGEPEFIRIGDTQLMKHTGRIAQAPGWIYTFYDLAHASSLITIYFNYKSDEPDSDIEREAEALLKTLELY